MRESGLLKNWVNKWAPNNLHCKGLGPVTQSKQATVQDFQGAFYLLIIGIVIAVIILVVEYIYSRRLRKSHTIASSAAASALSSAMASITGTMDHSNRIATQLPRANRTKISAKRHKNGRSIANGNGVFEQSNGISLHELYPLPVLPGLSTSVDSAPRAMQTTRADVISMLHRRVSVSNNATFLREVT